MTPRFGQTSRVIEQTLDPAWNQEFEFEGTLGHFASHTLQLDAVTNGRASGDYAGDGNWDIGGSSLLFWAVGMRPSKDNFWSLSTTELVTCMWLLAAACCRDAICLLRSPARSRLRAGGEASAPPAGARRGGRAPGVPGAGAAPQEAKDGSGSMARGRSRPSPWARGAGCCSGRRRRQAS